MDIKFRQQFIWLKQFKYVINNYVQLMINGYNNVPQLINHPLNTSNQAVLNTTNLNTTNHDFKYIF